MTWAAYIRVSTVDQHPENQRLELEQWLERRGVPVVWFEEKESTRKTRPVKQELLKRVRAGEFEGIAIWKLFRWARSSQELMPELEYFANNNIIFVSITDLGEVDTTTAFGKLIVQILSAFGEFERDLIRERTMAGLERAKKQGKRLGRPPGSKDTKRRRRSGYHRRYAKD